MHAGGLILLNLGDRLMGRNAVATLSPALARYGTIHYTSSPGRSSTKNDADNTRAIFRALGGNISLHAPQPRSPSSPPLTFSLPLPAQRRMARTRRRPLEPPAVV